MIPLTLAEVAEATGGVAYGVDPAAVVTGSVEYDSRLVTPGGLFVAFVGEHVDGHDYAERAMAAGAVAVLAARPLDGVPTIVVGHHEVVLAMLADAVLRRLPDLRIVGITGSSGKTTTKDLVAQLLSGLGTTVAAQGSFNNELGFPYTVLRAGADTEYLVLEYGARGIGHLRDLCAYARPDIAAVVNVGVAHIGAFGSLETTAAAKAELVEALTPEGLAILNADDERVRAMGTKGRVVLVGEAADADLRAVDVTVGERGLASYTLVTPEGSARVTLGVAGRHQVGNSLVAAAVGRELGLGARALGDILPRLRLVSARRMDVFDRGDGITVVDDSYNANPGSTAAALRALADIGGDRRRWAVLGYMAELGHTERAGHLEVGGLAAELGVDRVVAVGAEAGAVAEGADAVPGWTGEAVVVSDQQAAIALLAGELRPGDVVLVKGSRYRTWLVADYLREVAA